MTILHQLCSFEHLQTSQINHPNDQNNQLISAEQKNLMKLQSIALNEHNFEHFDQLTPQLLFPSIQLHVNRYQVDLAERDSDGYTAVERLLQQPLIYQDQSFCIQALLTPSFPQGHSLSNNQTNNPLIFISKYPFFIKNRLALINIFAQNALNNGDIKSLTLSLIAIVGNKKMIEEEIQGENNSTPVISINKDLIPSTSSSHQVEQSTQTTTTLDSRPQDHIEELYDIVKYLINSIATVHLSKQTPTTPTTLAMVPHDTNINSESNDATPTTFREVDPSTLFPLQFYNALIAVIQTILHNDHQTVHNRISIGLYLIRTLFQFFPTKASTLPFLTSSALRVAIDTASGLTQLDRDVLWAPLRKYQYGSGQYNPYEGTLALLNDVVPQTDHPQSYSAKDALFHYKRFMEYVDSIGTKTLHNIIKEHFGCEGESDNTTVTNTTAILDKLRSLLIPSHHFLFTLMKNAELNHLSIKTSSFTLSSSPQPKVIAKPHTIHPWVIFLFKLYLSKSELWIFDTYIFGKIMSGFSTTLSAKPIIDVELQIPTLSMVRFMLEYQSTTSNRPLNNQNGNSIDGLSLADSGKSDCKIATRNNQKVTHSNPIKNLSNLRNIHSTLKKIDYNELVNKEVKKVNDPNNNTTNQQTTTESDDEDSDEDLDGLNNSNSSSTKVHTTKPITVRKSPSPQQRLVEEEKQFKASSIAPVTGLVDATTRLKNEALSLKKKSMVNKRRNSADKAIVTTTTAAARKQKELQNTLVAYQKRLTTTSNYILRLKHTLPLSLYDLRILQPNPAQFNTQAAQKKISTTLSLVNGSVTTSTTSTTPSHDLKSSFPPSPTNSKSMGGSIIPRSTHNVVIHSTPKSLPKLDYSPHLVTFPTSLTLLHRFAKAFPLDKPKKVKSNSHRSNDSDDSDDSDESDSDEEDEEDDDDLDLPEYGNLPYPYYQHPMPSFFKSYTRLYNWTLSVYLTLPIDNIALARSCVVPLKHPHIWKKEQCIENDTNWYKQHYQSTLVSHTPNQQQNGIGKVNCNGKMGQNGKKSQSNNNGQSNNSKPTQKQSQIVRPSTPPPQTQLSSFRPSTPPQMGWEEPLPTAISPVTITSDPTSSSIIESTTSLVRIPTNDSNGLTIVPSRPQIGSLTFPSIIPKNLLPTLLGHDQALSLHLSSILTSVQSNPSSLGNSLDMGMIKKVFDGISTIPLGLHLPFFSLLHHNTTLSFETITAHVISTLSLYRLYHQTSINVLNNRDCWLTLMTNARSMVTPYQFTFLRPTPPVLRSIIANYSLTPDLNYPISEKIAFRGMRQPLLQALLYSGMPIFHKNVTHKRQKKDRFNFSIPKRWDFHFMFVADEPDLEVNDNNGNDDNDDDDDDDDELDREILSNAEIIVNRELQARRMVQEKTKQLKSTHSSTPSQTPILDEYLQRFLAQPRYIVNVDETDSDGLTLFARLVINHQYMYPTVRLSLLRHLINAGASPFVYGKQGVPLIHSIIGFPTLQPLIFDLVKKYPSLAELYNHHGLLPIHNMCSLVNAPFSIKSIKVLIENSNVDAVMTALKGRNNDVYYPLGQTFPSTTTLINGNLSPTSPFTNLNTTTKSSFIPHSQRKKAVYLNQNNILDNYENNGTYNSQLFNLDLYSKTSQDNATSHHNDNGNNNNNSSNNNNNSNLNYLNGHSGHNYYFNHLTTHNTVINANNDYDVEGFSYDNQLYSIDSDTVSQEGPEGVSLLHMMLGGSQYQFGNYNRYLTKQKRKKFVSKAKKSFYHLNIPSINSNRIEKRIKLPKVYRDSIFGKITHYQKQRLEIINNTSSPTVVQFWDEHIANAIDTVLNGIVAKIWSEEGISMINNDNDNDGDDNNDDDNDVNEEGCDELF